jgi:hypothetical protein
MWGFLAAVASLATPFFAMAVKEGQRTREEESQRQFGRREKQRQKDEDARLITDYGAERARIGQDMYDQSLQQQMTLARSGGTAASQAASQNQALNTAPATAINANLAATEGGMGYASLLGQNRLNQGALSLNKEQFEWQKGEHMLDRRAKQTDQMYGAMGGGLSSAGSMMGGGGGGAAAGLGGMLSDKRTKDFNRGVGYKWPAGGDVVSDERVKNAYASLTQAQRETAGSQETIKSKWRVKQAEEELASAKAAYKARTGWDPYMDAEEAAAADSGPLPAPEAPPVQGPAPAPAPADGSMAAGGATVPEGWANRHDDPTLSRVPAPGDPWGEKLPRYRWKSPGELEAIRQKLPPDHPYFRNPGGGLHPPTRSDPDYPTEGDLVDAEGYFKPSYEHIPEHERLKMAEEQGLLSARYNFTPGLFVGKRHGYDTGPDDQAMADFRRERWQAKNDQGSPFLTAIGLGGLNKVNKFFNTRPDFMKYLGPHGPKAADRHDEEWWRHNSLRLDREEAALRKAQLEALKKEDRAPLVRDANGDWVMNDPGSPNRIFRPTENTPGYFKDADGKIKSVFKPETWSDEGVGAPVTNEPPPLGGTTTKEEAEGYKDLIRPPAGGANQKTGDVELKVRRSGPSWYQLSTGGHGQQLRRNEPGFGDAIIDGIKKGDQGSESAGPVEPGQLPDKPLPSTEMTPTVKPEDMAEPGDAEHAAAKTAQAANSVYDQRRLEDLAKQAEAFEPAAEESQELAASAAARPSVSATTRLKNLRATQMHYAPYRLALSDEKTKAAQGGGGEASEALRSTPGYAYQYKDEFQGQPGTKPGPQYGIMAQDLEKSPAGATVVSEDEEGLKHVDPERLTMLNSAAIHDLLARLDKLEGGRRGLRKNRVVGPRV